MKIKSQNINGQWIIIRINDTFKLHSTVVHIRGGWRAGPRAGPIKKKNQKGAGFVRIFRNY